MNRSLHWAGAALAAVVLVPTSSHAHWVQTGFYECNPLVATNLTLEAPSLDGVFVPSTDTLLVLENSSPSTYTCACFVVYDSHQNRIGTFLTNLSPQDNDTYDVCQLTSRDMTKSPAVPPVPLPIPRAGTIEVVTVTGSCAKNGFAGTSTSGPSFRATTAAWTKFGIPFGPPSSGAPIIAFGPTDLKLVDTTINSGTGLASICSTTGVVVDDTSSSPQCVENSCDGP